MIKTRQSILHRLDSGQEHSLYRVDCLVTFPARSQSLSARETAHRVSTWAEGGSDRILLTETTSHGRSQPLQLPLQLSSSRENGIGIKVHHIPRLGLAGNGDDRTHKVHTGIVTTTETVFQWSRVLWVHLRVEGGRGVDAATVGTDIRVPGCEVHFGSRGVQASGILPCTLTSTLSVAGQIG